MLADLDLLLTTGFCPADDLLPERAKNARRRFLLRQPRENLRVARRRDATSAGVTPAPV